MTRIDQFESVFKAAARTVFVHQPVAIRRVAVLTDLDGADAAAFADGVRSFLATLEAGADGGEDREDIVWEVPEAGRSRSVGQVLELVETTRPDLICTYRNLHTDAWRWPYSLGDQVDVLTQATAVPILVLPRPGDPWSSTGTDSVMALTDHLSGDARLVSWAVRFTSAGGALCLAHVEDQKTFKRYLDVVAKIPEIDTDLAREKIAARLLHEAAEYMRSCQEVLSREALPVRLEEIVTFGRHLDEIRRLVDERGVDLLVLNTKDQDQLAMHGLAYPLAVELRSVPLLLL